jgi:hypothetical protein
MKTKDILLLVGGIALGYYLSKINFGKNIVNAVVKSENVAVDSKKTIECEKKWQDEIGSVSKLSAEALEKSKSDYVKTCMAT